MDEETTRRIIYTGIIALIIIINIALRKKRKAMVSQTKSPQPDIPTKYSVQDGKNVSDINLFPPIESKNEIDETINSNLFSYDEETIKEQTIKSTLKSSEKEKNIIHETKLVSPAKINNISIKFTAEELKKAVIYSEILKPLDI